MNKQLPDLYDFYFTFFIERQSSIVSMIYVKKAVSVLINLMIM